MQKIRKQIRGLYLSTAVGNLSLTGAWVAILAARGYSLAEIGLAETVFHITSLIFEIPSGVFADFAPGVQDHQPEASLCRLLNSSLSIRKHHPIV